MNRSPIILGIAVFGVTLAACSEPSAPGGGPGGGGQAVLAISADVSSAVISTVVVEVTAPDIPTPLVFNIEIVNGTASGTVTVPAGSARTITVRGFDAGAIETHRGSTTVAVRASSNPPIRITLLPLTGGQPIVVVISSLIVTIMPADYVLQRGQTVQLAAAVTDATGTAVPTAVEWASANPARASVTSWGMVTAAVAGPVDVVATAGGIGARSHVHVIPSEGLISGGSYHSCAVAAGGSAYCWGWNAGGQLGDGSTNDRLTPVLVAGGLAFATIAAGDHDVPRFTCGLTTVGSAYCWGENVDGSLGDGTATDHLNPTPVAGGLTFTSVAVSGGRACGLTAAGDAYCWGSNSHGELGDGTRINRNVPVRVPGGRTFTQISTGFYHTCGLAAGGAAYCWGLNESGQLGDGTSTDRPSPVPVAGGLSFTSVTAGANHTCAVTNDGVPFCWGINNVAELGIGTTDGPESCAIAGFTFSCSRRPVAVAGGFAFTSVAAGFDHTCGLTGGGAAYCWGFNYFGALGNGTTSDASEPTAVAGGLAFAALAGGSNHVCGVSAVGTVYCWGFNVLGQLGDGATSNRAVPTAVSGGLTFP